VVASSKKPAQPKKKVKKVRECAPKRFASGSTKKKYFYFYFWDV
jgi:hypothetical protein